MEGSSETKNGVLLALNIVEDMIMNLKPPRQEDTVTWSHVLMFTDNVVVCILR